MQGWDTSNHMSLTLPHQDGSRINLEWLREMHWEKSWKAARRQKPFFLWQRWCPAQLACINGSLQQPARCRVPCQCPARGLYFLWWFPAAFSPAGQLQLPDLQIPLVKVGLKILQCWLNLHSTSSFNDYASTKFPALNPILLKRLYFFHSGTRLVHVYVYVIHRRTK